METNKKWKRVSFDIELAKKIQAGEIEGKIKTRIGLDVRIICWDRKCGNNKPIVALVKGEHYDYEGCSMFSEKGEDTFGSNTQYDVVLEVPDNEPREHEFKPFDLETAKKIQAGEIEGKIKTKGGESVRIICFDTIGKYPILALVLDNKKNIEYCYNYCKNGWYIYREDSHLDLIIEVSENKPQFKPFDKVLVRQTDKDDWRVALYSHFNQKENIHVTAWLNWYQCIPYEGNEHLVGTTNKPNED